MRLAFLHWACCPPVKRRARYTLGKDDDFIHVSYAVTNTAAVDAV